MTTHSGQGVYFEPYTSTVLSPFTQGDGYVLDAFTLAGTADKPTLTQRRRDGTPPADVRPEVLAIRGAVAREVSAVRARRTARPGGFEP